MLPIPAIANFERNGWPEEGTPRLTARNDGLVLYKNPDTSSSKRQIKYKKGWLIVWDQSKVITKQSVTWIVKKEIDHYSCGKMMPGEKVEYLQYVAEGVGQFKVKGNYCQMDVYTEGDFNRGAGMPKTEWWVRVLDSEKSSIGWLLVSRGQVIFLERSF